MELTISKDVASELAYYANITRNDDLENKLSKKKNNYNLYEIHKIMTFISNYNMSDSYDRGVSFANKVIYFLLSNGLFFFTDYWGGIKRAGRNISLMTYIPYNNEEDLIKHCEKNKNKLKEIQRKNDSIKKSKSSQKYKNIRNIKWQCKECEWAYLLIDELCEEYNIVIDTCKIRYKQKENKKNVNGHYNIEENSIYLGFLCEKYEENLQVVLHEFAHAVQYLKRKDTVKKRKSHTFEFYKEILIPLLKRFYLLELSAKIEYRTARPYIKAEIKRLQNA